MLQTRICFVGQLALFLEEDPVVHFVILPNYQEDETLHRETLENLGRHPSAEKHMRMVLAMDRLVVATGHLLRNLMANCHPPGIAEEVSCTSIIQHPVGLSDRSSTGEYHREFARWAAAPERYFSSLMGTTPRTGFEGPQGCLFPEAPAGTNPRTDHHWTACLCPVIRRR